MSDETPGGEYARWLAGSRHEWHRKLPLDNSAVWFGVAGQDEGGEWAKTVQWLNDHPPTPDYYAPEFNIEPTKNGEILRAWTDDEAREWIDGPEPDDGAEDADDDFNGQARDLSELAGPLAPLDLLSPCLFPMPVGDAGQAELSERDEISYFNAAGEGIGYEQWERLRGDAAYCAVATTVFDRQEVRTRWTGRVVDTDAGGDFDEHGHPLIFETVLDHFALPRDRDAFGLPSLGESVYLMGRWPHRAAALDGHQAVVRTLKWMGAGR